MQQRLRAKLDAAQLNLERLQREHQLLLAEYNKLRGEKLAAAALPADVNSGDTSTAALVSLAAAGGTRMRFSSLCFWLCQLKVLKTALAEEAVHRTTAEEQLEAKQQELAEAIAERNSAQTALVALRTSTTQEINQLKQKAEASNAELAKLQAERAALQARVATLEAVRPEEVEDFPLALWSPATLLAPQNEAALNKKLQAEKAAHEVRKYRRRCCFFIF